MSSAKVEPRQPSRAMTKSHGRLLKAKSADPARREKPQGQISSREMRSASQTGPRTLLGTESEDAEQSRELLQVQSLLARIWHRNRNQHRGQKWWKWMTILKGSVRDLVGLAQPSEEAIGLMMKSPEGEVSEAERLRKRMEGERVRREQRHTVEEWVREVVLGKCWLAFSTLVADSQFSALGLVLLAILARVGKVVGLPKPALPAPPDLQLGAQPNTTLATSLTEADVDRGEVVERISDGGVPKHARLVRRREEMNVLRTRTMKDGEAEDRLEHEAEDVDIDVTGSQSLGAAEAGIRDHSEIDAVANDGIAGKPSTVAQRKKRRKKGNAIDDLFAGLS